MPRRRAPGSPKVVCRTARAGLRVTRGQRRRLTGLLVAAGDVWACVLELNAWRRARQDPALASYPELCRELAASGPGAFGELDTVGARSVLRRYSDAWHATAKRRREGDDRARFPRRRRRLVPVRWYHGTFRLDGRVLQVPVARGCPRLRVRLDRDLPYPPGQVRSVTLLFDAGRLWADVTAEVPVAVYPAGREPDPGQVAGIDLGIIHPYAVAGPDAEGLLVSGRAIRAEHRRRRVPKPAGRVLTCPHCTFTGHRDLVAAASIAARAGGGTTPAILVPAGVTHRRAGNHLPGVSRARRDPRRRPHRGRARRSPGRHRPAPPAPSRAGRGVARLAARTP
jgi:transposase